MSQNIDFNVAIIHIERESIGTFPGYYIQSNYNIELDIGIIMGTEQHRIYILSGNHIIAPIQVPIDNNTYWSLGENILLIVRLYNNILRTDIIQSKTPNYIYNINLNNNNDIQISGTILTLLRIIIINIV